MKINVEVLIVLFVLGCVIWAIPKVGKYFSEINTMVHEMGHAIVSILTSGKVKYIEIFSNAEGDTETETKKRAWLSRFLTNLSGYVSPSLFVFISVKYLLFTSPKIILFILAGEAIYIIILWIWNAIRLKIRNIYGFVWTLSFLGIMFVDIFHSNHKIVFYSAFFLVSLLFQESIRTAWIILKLSYKNPKEAGDASNLAKSTKILPAFIWGIVFFAQSLMFAGWSIYVGFSHFGMIKSF